MITRMRRKDGGGGWMLDVTPRGGGFRVVMLG